MNLHAIAAPAIAAVNPPITGTLKISTGYTTAPDGKQVPSYSFVEGVIFDVQMLTAKELAHLDSLNIQGIMRAVYLDGNIEGVDRAAGKGGDLLYFLGADWLVTTVLEPWDSSGWCKVSVTKQAKVVTP